MTDAPFDEQYDTQMEVERNPCGAWMAIQAQARDLLATRAALAEAQAEVAHWVKVNNGLCDGLEAAEAALAAARAEGRREAVAALAAAPAQDVVAAIDPASTFYIDCEFDGHDGPLLSIAMVRGDGHSLHIAVNEEACDPWVRENVLPIMQQHEAGTSLFSHPFGVGYALRAFIGDCEAPTIIADSPVDIGRFCRAISTGQDGLWASTGYPRMAFAVVNVDCYPSPLPGAVQHNAWWDAMSLRAAIRARIAPADILDRAKGGG